MAQKSRRSSKISPIFKKRLDFFRHLGRAHIQKQKKILKKCPAKVSSDLVKLVKLVKKNPVPSKHYRKIQPFRKLINKISSNKIKSRKSLAQGIKGGFITALLPILASLASAGIQEIIKIV